MTQNNISICIPTIYKSISRSDIFEYMNFHIGSVSRIDFVDLNEHNRSVFIHFSEWHVSDYAALVAYQLDKNGSCHVALPNIKNKKNPIFHATMLVNKNPLSSTDSKIKKLHKVLGEWTAVNREQQHKIDVLESKVLLMEDALNKLYGSYYGTDMDINELDC
jgi:hypothetical protein